MEGESWRLLCCALLAASLALLNSHSSTASDGTQCSDEIAKLVANLTYWKQQYDYTQTVEMAADGMQVASEVAEALSREFLAVDSHLLATADQVKQLYKRSILNSSCCNNSSSCCSSCSQTNSSSSSSSSDCLDADVCLEYVSARWKESVQWSSNGSSLTLNQSHPSFPAGADFSQTAIHIPVNIYNQSKDVLCAIQWSSGVKEYLANNWDNLSSFVSTQFFATQSGPLHIYPAQDWEFDNNCSRCPYDPVDFFDSRSRPWFVNSVGSGGKLVAIVMDMSGSMFEFKSRLAKLMANEILKTLSADDHFTVIVSPENQGQFIHQRFNKEMIYRASPENVIVMNSLLLSSSLSASGEADLDGAIGSAMETLVNGSLSACHKLLVLLTDSSADISEDLTDSLSQEKEVKVLVYQAGLGRNEMLDRISCMGKKSVLVEFTDVVQETQNIPAVLRGGDGNLSHDRYRGVTQSLVFTTSTPVFHEMEEGSDSVLLGVLGMDTPLPLIMLRINKHYLGGFGYGFLMDNRGQLIAHPLLRDDWPASLDDLVSLPASRFELTEEESAFLPVQEAMLNRLQGQTGPIAVWLPGNRMKRESYKLVNMSYSYAPVNGTGFSVAIVTPVDQVVRRMNVSEKGVKLCDAMSLAALPWDFALAPRPYCLSNTLFDHGVNPAISPAKFLQWLSDNGENLTDLGCDPALCKPILWDCNSTLALTSTDNIPTNTSLFVQTSSGFTACWQTHSNVTCADIASTDYLFLVSQTGSSSKLSVYRGPGGNYLAAVLPLAAGDVVIGVVGYVLEELPCAEEDGQFYLVNELWQVLNSHEEVLPNTTCGSRESTAHTLSAHTLYGYELEPCHWPTLADVFNVTRVGLDDDGFEVGLCTQEVLVQGTAAAGLMGHRGREAVVCDDLARDTGMAIDSSFLRLIDLPPLSSSCRCELNASLSLESAMVLVPDSCGDNCTWRTPSTTPNCTTYMQCSHGNALAPNAALLILTCLALSWLQGHVKTPN